MHKMHFAAHPLEEFNHFVAFQDQAPPPLGLSLSLSRHSVCIVVYRLDVVDMCEWVRLSTDGLGCVCLYLKRLLENLFSGDSFVCNYSIHLFLVTFVV